MHEETEFYQLLRHRSRETGETCRGCAIVDYNTVRGLLKEKPDEHVSVSMKKYGVLIAFTWRGRV